MPINWQDYEVAESPSETATAEPPKPKISWEDYEPVKRPSIAAEMPSFETTAKIRPPTPEEAAMTPEQAGREESPTFMPSQPTVPIGSLLLKGIQGLRGESDWKDKYPKVHAWREGLEETAAENIDALSSPENLALMGLGGEVASLGKWAGSAVGATFGYLMAKDAPELWRQFKAEEDPKKQAALATQFAISVGGGALGALGAAMPFLPKAKPPIIPPEVGPRATPEMPGPPAEPIRPPTAAAEIPTIQKPSIEREVPSAIQEREAEKVLPDVQTQPGSIAKPVPAEEGDLGIRAGAEAEKGPTQREVLLKDRQRYDELRDQIKDNSKSGKSIEQIFSENADLQKEIEQIKNRHGGKPPVVPQVPGALSVKAEADHVHGLDEQGVSGLKQFRGRYGDGLTGYAYEVGSSVKTQAELDALLEGHDRYVAELRERRKAGNIKGIGPLAGKKQFFTEAYEAATGNQAHKPGEEGSALRGIREYDPNYQPPMAPKQVSENLRPSVDLPTGERAVAGPGEVTHGDVLKKAGVDPESIPHEDPARAFTDITTGERLTRKQAEKATGIEGTAKAGGLDSTDLPRAETPKPAVVAAAKVESEIAKTFKSEGASTAKEAKSQIVEQIEKAIEEAPKLTDVERKTAVDAKMRTYETQPDRKTKITIDIPGDGVFTVWNTKENLTELLSRAKKISTKPTGEKPFKESKPAAGIPPDVFVESSEPTRMVWKGTKKEPVSWKGKLVELDTPNAKGLKTWLTSDGNTYEIIEESTGLRIGEGQEKASIAIKKAAEKLDEFAKTKPIPELLKQQVAAGNRAKPPEPLTTGEARPITEEGGTAYSGPVLGIDEFVKKDVAPFLKKGVDAGRALVDIMVDTFSPASRTATRDVDVLFSSKGYKEKVMTRAADALGASKAMFDKLPEAEQIAFVDRVKRGQRQPTPELQHAADLMRKWDDRLFAMVKRYRPDLPYLENHNRVLWKVIPGSPEALGTSAVAIRSRRPWQGSKGFLRRHVLEDMSEGIKLGGVPVTYNPIEMFLLHAEDAMKFVAANRAWEGLKKTGSVEWVKTGQKAPDGYVRISDSIAKPYFRTPQGLLAKPGEWYVEEGAARMIENYLSRDYIRTGKFGSVGRSMIALKNATTAIELGLSPFHAVFESNEVMGSSIGLGISKLASGKISGLKDILTAPISPKSTAALGKLGIRYAKNPTEFAKVYPDAYKWFTTKYPEAGKLLDDLFAGGGQVAMNEDYRIRGITGFKKAVREGNYPGALLRSFPALNELAMKPLFQTYIPRLKVGMFLREYSFELERNAEGLASGKITRPELARKTWSFIEDRFGELNFDNLYWDRTFKSAMQILFRSVTWKLGNIRGFGKATRDIWTEGLKPLLKGEKPRVTLPMAWLAGMAIVTALQASIISKVSTGKYPWELAKDAADELRNLVFPRIDPGDERQRVSIPTYWRDLTHLAHSPVGYVGSSMTGEWRRLYDDLVNRDFYRHPIYNPNDPIQKKAVASLGHLIPLPFGLSSFIGATQEGVAPARAAAGFLGFTKAPGYISPPTAQTQVRDLALKWKTESKIPKLVNEAQRQATEQFEPSDYLPLRQALKNRNYDGARKALDKLLADGHTTKNISQTMRPLNSQGKPKPFTGSQLQEKYFLQSLTDPERELYRDAVRERIELYRNFKKMLKQSTPQNN